MAGLGWGGQLKMRERPTSRRRDPDGTERGRHPGFLAVLGGLLLAVALLLPAAAAHAAPPANDDFADAEVLGPALPINVSGTNVDATSQLGEPDNAGQGPNRSVWYRWTAPSSGPVAITTNGSDFDTTLGVYTGPAVDTLSLVDDDDDGGFGLDSRVQFNAVSGTTYRISVDGFDSTEFGDVELSIETPSPPDNDDFADATELDLFGVSDFADNGLATKQAGEPNHAGNAGGHSVWYSFTPTDDTTYRIDTCGSDIDTLAAVYTGSAVNALTSVASNDDSPRLWRRRRGPGCGHGGNDVLRRDRRQGRRHR